MFERKLATQKATLAQLFFHLRFGYFEQEIRSQAAAIVGSVDFLGNPMGLINDVSSGLEGLVKRGNVGGLFMNVAHGVSDSAAKVSKAVASRNSFSSLGNSVT